MIVITNDVVCIKDYKTLNEKVIDFELTLESDEMLKFENTNDAEEILNKLREFSALFMDFKVETLNVLNTKIWG